MKNIVTGISSKVKEWFSLDYRSLALMRIGIGLTLIFDLIQRSFDVRAFYSDAGVLPRAELLRLWENKWWFSIHMMNGLTSFEVLLLIIAGIFALMLLLGYRTQLAIIMSWIFLISIQVRNPVVLQGGDVVFRAVIFWMIFLPLNRVWSLDRLFNKVPRPQQETFFSVASIAYIIQICLLYVFTGILKTGAAWHNGTAVYYALNVDQLITPLGAYLREFPNIMSALTYATWYLEVYGTLLFFSPVATGFFRTLGIFFFACLQIGFNSSMRLGLFGMIAIVITLGLLPSGFWNDGWNRFVNWIAMKGKHSLTIYYDFECSFCYKSSFLLRRILFLNPDTKILPAHTDPEIEKLMLEKDSWVIVDAHGNKHTSWSGGVTLAAYSPLFWWVAPILRAPVISHTGEKIYRLISKKRKQVCTPEPLEEEPKQLAKTGRALRDMMLIALIIYVIAWNFDTIEGSKKIISVPMQWIGWVTHLDQKFNMFAPTPLTEDGWYVFPGKLRDGTEVDVFSGKVGTVSYAKPEYIAYAYKNQRWQKYMMNLWSRDFTDYRLGYGKYLCREWNATHQNSKQLMNFDMIFMVENTQPPSAKPIPVTPTTIWKHQCF